MKAITDKIEDKKHKTVVLPVALTEQIHNLARNRYSSDSQIIRELLAVALASVELSASEVKK